MGDGARYAARGVLVACPFCREMFDRRERKSCPMCGVALVAFERLAPSGEELGEDGLSLSPELERLPLAFLGRGRGLLAALALAGLAAFAMPWIHVTLPDIVTYSGIAVARRLGWAWGAGVGWFVLLPTVLSRRNIAQMRGARVAAAFLSSVPGVTALVLLLRPPHGSHGVPLRFTFGEGVYATLALSAVALAVSVLLGGRVDDIRLRRGTSRGEVVH
jgi:hypothetical protein